MADQGGILGLTPHTRAELTNFRTQERAAQIQQGIGSLGLRDPASMGASQFGGLLGLAISQKMRPGSILNPTDQKNLAVADRANALYTSKLQTLPANSSDEDKALEMQMAAAQAHYENGNFDQYHSLVLDAAQKRRARQQAASQQQLLENAVDRGNVEALVGRAQMDKILNGEPTTFFAPGEDPTTADPRVGHLMPDGTMEVRSNDGSVAYTQEWIPADIMLSAYQLRRQREAMGLTDKQTPDKLWNSAYTDQTRVMGENFYAMAENTEKITANMASLANQNIDPNAALGVPGAALPWITKVVSGLRASTSVAGRLFDANTGETITSGDMTTIEEYQAVAADPVLGALVNGIQLPKTIVVGSREAESYKAQIVQLAYTMWRSMEGEGSRQASNQDFANALAALGAASGDVNTLFGELGNMLQKGSDKMTQRFVGSVNQGKEFLGWDANRVDNYLFNSMYQPAQRKLGIARDRINILGGKPPRDILEEERTNPGTVDAWNQMTPQEKAELFPDLFNGGN